MSARASKTIQVNLDLPKCQEASYVLVNECDNHILAHGMRDE